MAFSVTTTDDESRDPPTGLLRNIRNIIKRVDPRRSYHVEPTWRINGVPMGRSASLDIPPVSGARRSRRYDYDDRPQRGSSSFRALVRDLHSSELRELIMNACLKSSDAHRDVINLLKRMQRQNPRSLAFSGNVQNPTAGLYLYCRSQRELVDIVLELEATDETGRFRQEMRELIGIIQAKEGVRR